MSVEKGPTGDKRKGDKFWRGLSLRFDESTEESSSVLTHCGKRWIFLPRTGQAGRIVMDLTEPIAVGTVSAAAAVHVASRRWFGFFRQAARARSKI
jgi:hypothetical protein